MDINKGEVYLSYRTDTYDAKNKFQIYFDDSCVLLINTKQGKFSISTQISPSECSLLSHTSYICLDTVFEYDRTQKIIKKEELHQNVLKRLKMMLPCSQSIPQITIDKIIKYIDDLLN